MARRSRLRRYRRKSFRRARKRNTRRIHRFRSNHWNMARKIFPVKLKQLLTIAGYPIQPVANTGVYGAIRPYLGLFKEAENISNSFDFYRIRGIKLSFYPNDQLVTAIPSSANGAIGNFNYFTDPDGTYTLPTSAAQFYAHYGCQTRMAQAQKPWHVYFKPKLSAPVYSDTVISSYGIKSEKTWLDTNYPDVPYYGFYFYWEPQSIAQIIDVYITAYIEFKGFVGS